MRSESSPPLRVSFTDAVWPSYGLLDIDIGTQRANAEDGLDVTITIENASEDDRETFFKVNKVEVAVEGFAIRIHDSQHPVRNWLAKPALRSYLETSFISVVRPSLCPSDPR